MSLWLLPSLYLFLVLCPTPAEGRLKCFKKRSHKDVTLAHWLAKPTEFEDGDDGGYNRLYGDFLNYCFTTHAGGGYFASVYGITAVTKVEVLHDFCDHHDCYCRSNECNKFDPSRILASPELMAIQCYGYDVEKDPNEHVYTCPRGNSHCFVQYADHYRNKIIKKGCATNTAVVDQSQSWESLKVCNYPLCNGPYLQPIPCHLGMKGDVSLYSTVNHFFTFPFMILRNKERLVYNYCFATFITMGDQHLTLYTSNPQHALYQARNETCFNQTILFKKLGEDTRHHVDAMYCKCQGTIYCNLFLPSDQKYVFKSKQKEVEKAIE